MKLLHLGESSKRKKSKLLPKNRVCVATENSLSRQGLHGTMLRHNFLCRDMVLRSGTRPGLGASNRRARAAGTPVRQGVAMSLGLGSRHNILCRDRVGQSCVKIENFLSQ